MSICADNESIEYKDYYLALLLQQYANCAVALAVGDNSTQETISFVRLDVTRVIRGDDIVIGGSD